MKNFKLWLGGARPRTLPLSVLPVILAVALVSLEKATWFSLWYLDLLCLVVAVALQVGVNYANDYSDGKRGTDKDRVGPERLVGSGKVPAKLVLRAAGISFAIAVLAGLTVVLLTMQWWLILVGALCVLGAWFYTGGKKPYGYKPLGELAVLIFFGIIPVVGVMFVNLGHVSFWGWWGGVAVGLMAAAVLMINNIRDLEKDQKHHKKTLATYLGPGLSRLIYGELLIMPFAMAVILAVRYPYVWAVLFVMVLALQTISRVNRTTEPKQLVALLGRTVQVAILYTLVLSVALVLK